ncbi:MAG TPA: hypothetical protein VGI39_23525 [Polyangiaceae bacterium]|jgi:hypothetical protein
MLRRPGELTSGFVRFDYLVTVTVADPVVRQQLAARFDEEWDGTRTGEATWEIATALSPAEFEEALAPHLAPGDRAVFYYLADTKRFFRVVVEA